MYAFEHALHGCKGLQNMVQWKRWAQNACVGASASAMTADHLLMQNTVTAEWARCDLELTHLQHVNECQIG